MSAEYPGHSTPVLDPPSHLPFYKALGGELRRPPVLLLALQIRTGHPRPRARAFDRGGLAVAIELAPAWLLATLVALTV